MLLFKWWFGFEVVYYNQFPLFVSAWILPVIESTNVFSLTLLASRVIRLMNKNERFGIITDPTHSSFLRANPCHIFKAHSLEIMNLIRSFRRTVEPPITNPLLIKPLFMKSFPKPFPWYFHVNRSMTKDRPFQGRFAWVLGWLELNGSTVSLQYLEDLERFWLQCVTFAHQIYFRDSARVVSDCICIKLFTCICLNPLVYT